MASVCTGGATELLIACTGGATELLLACTGGATELLMPYPTTVALEETGMVKCTGETGC